MKTKAKKPGQAPHEPDDKRRGEVTAYAALGVPHHDIALLVGINTRTLLKYYDYELKFGKAKANSAMAKRLWEIGQKGNLGAIIFWLKSQAGWREVQRIEHTGADGKPIETKHSGKIDSDVSPDEAMRAYLEIMDGNGSHSERRRSH